MDAIRNKNEVERMVERCAKHIHNYFNAKDKREFVTVIIGSGASASPKTDILINGLISILKEEVFLANAMVHFGKTKEECTLEESFSILAKIKGEKSIHNFLKNKEIIKREDNIYPTKGYEFLAHLANHKLIHNIITTNFDEELEISLDDEIGRENYRIVKSLSEFDAFNMEIENEKEKENENESKKPILFKVHGTISYPRTIRVTIDNVKNFEDEKLRAIKWVLCNTKILIIIGFGFRDVDFRHAFSEALKEKAFKEKSNDKILICWIHRNVNRREEHNEFLDSIINKNFVKRRIEDRYLIAMKSDDFLMKLAEHIGQYDENKKIPTIARQKIRNLIMEYPNNMDIRERKFYIELLIFALTVKGLFGINALKDCNRVQKYCNEFIKLKRSPYTLLDNLVKNGLIKRMKDKNIYYLPEIEIDTLTNNIIKFFNLDTIDEKSKNELKSQLEILDQTFDVDIVEPDASVYLMFKKPQPIRNHNEWEEKTKEFLERAKIIKIIAQTGEWITKDANIIKFLNKIEEVQLITCEKFENAGMHSKRQNDIEAKLISMFGNKIKIKYLPWERISEHIKLNDKGQGMYMKRIGKSSVVAPVWINNKHDGEVLSKMFDYYWETAEW